MISTPIYIDFNALVEEFTLDTHQVDSLMEFVIKGITIHFYNSWVANANKELSSTRKDYVNSLKIIDRGKFRGEIKLFNFLPNALEEGIGPFDLKSGFLKSGKVKESKDGGRYLTIPYSFLTPKASENSGIFAMKMPEVIYKQARNLEYKQVLNINDIPEEYRAPKVRKENITFPAYENKSSIYEGLQKLGSKNNTQYIAFRRVSLNSDPNAWIHSGLTARKIMEKTLSGANIPEMVGKLTDKFIDNN